MQGRKPRQRRTALVASLAGLMLPGCAADSQPRLKALADRLVQPGLTLPEAETRLEAAGFTCGSRTAAPLLTCSRVRSDAVLATCIQRIELAVAPADGSVSRVDVPRPACTGF